MLLENFLVFLGLTTLTTAYSTPHPSTIFDGEPMLNNRQIRPMEALLKAIRSQCNVNDDIASPKQGVQRLFDDNQPLQLRADIVGNHVVGIDDISETFSLEAGLIVSWSVPCVAAVTSTFNFSIEELRQGVLFDSNPTKHRYWMIALFFRNGRNDLSAANGFMDNFIMTFATGTLTRQIIGQFDSQCDLDLEKFPFDKQHCELQISLPMPLYLFNFTQCSLNLNKNAVSDAAQFILGDSGCNLESVVYPPYGVFSQVSFWFDLSRKPRYFILNVLTPCLILAILQLATFLIPPDQPERPVFAMAVVLAFTMTLGQLIGNLPQTSQNIIMTDFVVAEMVFGTLCTVYSAATCMSAHSCSQPNHVTTGYYCGFKLSTARFVDLICGTIATAVILAVFLGCMLHIAV